MHAQGEKQASVFSTVHFGGKAGTTNGLFALRLLGGRPCMSKSEKYQRFAEECVQIARTAKDDQVKAVLMHMARVWLRLAADRAKKSEEEETT